MAAAAGEQSAEAAAVLTGYTDDDVKEVARAFTGWAMGNGRWNGAGNFPNTGEFIYHDAWHDHFQKWVLGVRLRSNQGPMVDGRMVLDILANHPATARRLCRKLCRRLVGDNPPEALVERAAAVWLANIAAPNQIALVARAIALSPEFAQTFGDKVKRPLEMVASFLRGMGAEFRPTKDLHRSMLRTGFRLFEYPTPDGPPEASGDWLSSNTMLRNWNLCNDLLQRWMASATFDVPGETSRGAAHSCVEIVDYWSQRLLGRPLEGGAREQLIDFLAQGGDRHATRAPRRDAPDWGSPEGVRDRIVATAMLVVMSPDFLAR